MMDIRPTGSPSYKGKARLYSQGFFIPGCDLPEF